MAFDPTDRKPPEAKKLPVVLLLDVSASMGGEKINTLYDSVVDMVNSFVAAKVKEIIIEIAIITFGEKVSLHTPYTSVDDLQNKGISKFKADGMTPMGTALEMAKEMIDDKETTPTKIYRPAVVLVSDGKPNDSWRKPLSDFIHNGRSAKCQRFAIPIGNDADRAVLEEFAGDEANVFYAENAADITDSFQMFTMSVSTRAASRNPNSIPRVSNASYDNNTAQDSDDDDEYI